MKLTKLNTQQMQLNPIRRGLAQLMAASLTTMATVVAMTSIIALLSAAPVQALAHGGGLRNQFEPLKQACTPEQQGRVQDLYGQIVAGLLAASLGAHGKVTKTVVIVSCAEVGEIHSDTDCVITKNLIEACHSVDI